MSLRLRGAQAPRPSVRAKRQLAQLTARNVADVQRLARNEACLRYLTRTHDQRASVHAVAATA
jgi:hypothetical protein